MQPIFVHKLRKSLLKTENIHPTKTGIFFLSAHEAAQPAAQGLIVGEEYDAAEDDGYAEQGDGSGPRPRAEGMLPRVQPVDVQIDKRIVDGVERIGEATEEVNGFLPSARQRAARSEPDDERKRHAHRQTLIDGVERLDTRQCREAGH